MEKPGTPGSKPRATTPNAAAPGALKSSIPPAPAGYPPSPYQRSSDLYQRPLPESGYGRPPNPFDPHGHVRTNGMPLTGGITGGKPYVYKIE